MGGSRASVAPEERAVHGKCVLLTPPSRPRLRTFVEGRLNPEESLRHRARVTAVLPLAPPDARPGGRALVLLVRGNAARRDGAPRPCATLSSSPLLARPPAPAWPSVVRNPPLARRSSRRVPLRPQISSYFGRERAGRRPVFCSRATTTRDDVRPRGPLETTRPRPGARAPRPPVPSRGGAGCSFAVVAFEPRRPRRRGGAGAPCLSSPSARSRRRSYHVTFRTAAAVV